MPREEEIKGLIKNLGHTNPDIALKAREKLVGMGRPAISHLAKALRDKHWKVRENAARTLGEIGHPDGGPPLIKALKDKDIFVRGDALLALGKIGHPDAVPHLINALNDSWRALVAAEALKNIGRKLSKVPPKKNEPKEVKALRLVGKHFVENEDPNVVIEAVEAALKKEIDEKKAPRYVKRLRAVYAKIRRRIKSKKS